MLITNRSCRLSTFLFSTRDWEQSLFLELGNVAAEISFL